MPIVSRLWQMAPQPIVDAPLVEDDQLVAVQGQIIYDLPNGKLWSMSLNSGREPSPLFRLPPGTFAFQPVWSAVTQQLAYGYIQPDPETGQLMNAQLWVASLDGSNSRQITQPPPGFAGTYRDPAWSSGGNALWATVQLPEQDSTGVVRFRSEIRYIDLNSGTETIIFSNAYGPAIAPDGESIAYLVPDTQSQRAAIWLAAIDGSNQHMLVPGEQLEEIYVPMRFSPDGRTLAFAAADAANQLQRTPPANSNSWFLMPKKLHAHGLYPADIWLVDLQSGKLERLTQLSEDHPTPVWSPDGHYLAFAGVLGLYLIDVVDHNAVRITEQGIDGQIDWVDR